MRNPVLTIILSMLLVCTSGSVHAAVFRPVVCNFTIKEYGQEASHQNWDCCQDENGHLYVANNNCLLRYDGFTWKQITLRGRAMIRSVHAYGDRIYVGMFEEFGYFSRDAFGVYSYTPLATCGKGDEQSVLMINEEPWVIIDNAGVLFFQSFSGIYTYDGKEVKKLELNGNRPLFIFKAGNHIYMQAIMGDFYRIDGKRQTKLIARTDLGDDDIVGVVPLHGDAQAMVLVSKQHGLYTYRNGQVSKMPTAIDSQLANVQVNKACATHDGTIVLGTIQNGLWGISSKGEMLWHFNTDSGLADNAVLRLLCDRDDNVWACLDEGISMIACGKPYDNLTVNTQMSSVGMIYALHFDGNDMLMATNQGVYACDITQTGSKPRLVTGTEGQNWYLTRIDGTLYAGNNSGPLRIVGGRAERIEQSVSSSTCLRKTVWHGEEILIESTYNTLRVYRRKGDGWSQYKSVDNFNHPVRQIEIDNDGSLWASNMQKGVYHLWLSDDLSQVTRTRHYERIDSVETRCFVTRLANRIVLADDNRLYVYDHAADSIMPFDTLNKILPSTSGITNIIATDTGDEWWVCSQDYYMLVSQSGKGWRLKRCVSARQLGMYGNDCNAQAVQVGSKVYFNMAHGVACIDMLEADASHTYPMLLDEASYRDNRDTYHQLRLADVMEGRAQVDGNILLRFTCPDYGKEVMTFRFTIVKGKEQIVVESREPRLVLPNIPYGTYKIRGEVIGQDGQVRSTLQAGFVVPRPWYLKWWTLLIALIILSLGCWGLAQLTARRQLAQQHLKMLEQERIISEQRQQLLQKELSEKSKNLAAMSLDVAVKQNVINSLRDSIIEQKKKGNISKNDMKAQLQRIQQTSSDKEFWDIFKQNFDLIHEHFFRNLKAHYPTLTANDLKFCALLRMNLSTKEIANFTNLSIRGVESARLRLRHKFKLTTEQNLVEFLIAFNPKQPSDDPSA